MSKKRSTDTKNIEKKKVTEKSVWNKTVEEITGPVFRKVWNEIDDTAYNVQFGPISEYTSKEFAFAFLLLAAAGALTFTAAAIPGVGIIYKIFGANTKAEKHRVYQAIRRYKRRGLITFKDGRIMITADGNRLLSTYQARNLFFKKPGRWDGKWRMVMFDIPGKYENERKIVRMQLEEFGFRVYQESVFVSPYDCEEIISKLKNHLAIDGYVRYITVQSFDQEEKFKKLFKLQNS